MVDKLHMLLFIYLSIYLQIQYSEFDTYVYPTLFKLLSCRKKIPSKVTSAFNEVNLCAILFWCNYSFSVKDYGNSIISTKVYQNKA